MHLRKTVRWLVLAMLLVQAPVAADERGPVTNLPLPRFVSLKASEGNVRRGPSLSHRIDWVFRRRGMPLEITGEYGHWRRVRDHEGAGGWVHYSLLSGSRTAIVLDEIAPLRARPSEDAPVTAWAERNVIGRLETCEAAWCRLRANGRRGWIRSSALWAAEPAHEPQVAQND